MTLSVYNSQFKTGIDTSVLREVSQEILKRAAEKNSQYSNVNSVNNIFKTADLGVNLYNGSVDNNTARQIAMNNSGLNIQLNQNVLDSVKFLNTQAAQNIHKNVEGKLTVAINEGVGTAKNAEAPTAFNSIVSLATGKDKNSSNPRYNGELLAMKKNEEKAEEAINIFA